MSVPVILSDLIIFKMVKEYEKTNKTNYPIDELLSFSHEALKIAGEMDNEQYWIVTLNKLGPSFCKDMSPICDIDIDCFTLNEEKYMNGGREYAYSIIQSMSESFYKAATICLTKELNNDNEALCD